MQNPDILKITPTPAAAPLTPVTAIPAAQPVTGGASGNPVAGAGQTVVNEPVPAGPDDKKPFPWKLVIIFLAVLLLGIFLGYLATNTIRNNLATVNITPTVTPANTVITGTPAVTQTGNVTSTPAATVGADAYSGWKDYTNNDYKITFKAPAGYTVSQVDTPLAKDTCNKLTADISYKEIRIMNGSKLILFSYFNQEGGDPYGCGSIVPPGEVACTKIFETAMNGHTYTLWEDPDMSPALQIMETRLTPGNGSILTEESSMCSGGTFFNMNSYGVNFSTPGPAFTRDEFDNAVKILASVRSL